jgi:phage recombination protein Bet
MSNIIPVGTGPLAQLADPKRLKLIRDTVAKQASETEFNWFIDICRHTRLDPLRKQIYCFVFHASDAKKRQMVPVTAIGGLRAIAQRTGTYRADNRAPRLETDESLRDSLTNPLGIIRAEVSVFQHSHGEWHEIVGEAYWEEFAPIVDEWVDDPEAGRRRPSGKRMLDKTKDGWRRMPRLMLAKCAEAVALRKAWPDDLGNLYEETEIDRHQTLDLMPSEIIDQTETESKLEMIGGKDALIVDWCDGGSLRRVALGQFFDASLKWAREDAKDAATIEHWMKRNNMVRAEVKAKKPKDYLEWHAMMEKILNGRLSAEATTGEGQ